MKKLYLLFWLLWMLHCVVFPQAVQLKQNPFTSDYSYHSFRHVELPSYANIVNTLIQDDQGMMWIGTKRGLFSYNGYNVNYHMCEGDLLESPIQAITQVSSRYLCIGRDGGLRLFDLYRWKLLKDAVDRINNEASTYNFWYEYRNYRGEMEYVWPIPQTEIDCNSQLVQHELWK